jgi:predicted YcjX-like family ATPase
VKFVRFRPPPLREEAGFAGSLAWPHVRLDRAMEFLLGDWLG